MQTHETHGMPEGERKIVPNLANLAGEFPGVGMGVMPSLIGEAVLDWPGPLSRKVCRRFLRTSASSCCAHTPHHAAAHKPVKCLLGPCANMRLYFACESSAFEGSPDFLLGMESHMHIAEAHADYPRNILGVALWGRSGSPPPGVGRLPHGGPARPPAARGSAAARPRAYGQS